MSNSTPERGHKFAAEHYAPEQETSSDHMHHTTWQPHDTDPCGDSGDHATSTTGPDMVCDEGNSTSQRLTSRPMLAIAIGKSEPPQLQDKVCGDAEYH